MKKDSFAYRVFDLYYEGFRNMRLGRTLWAVILIKLFIIFALLVLILVIASFVNETDSRMVT